MWPQSVGGVRGGLGGDIQERDKLLVVTPEHLRTTLNVDVRTEHEVLAIDRQAHQVMVHDRVSPVDQR